MATTALGLLASSCGLEGRPDHGPLDPGLDVEFSSDETTPPPRGRKSASDSRSPAPVPTATTASGTASSPRGEAGTPSWCRDSFAPACGAFSFEPDPDNRDLTLEVTFAPAEPRAGDNVRFSLKASDPDSRFLEVGTYRFAKDMRAVAPRSGSSGGCRQAFGPWRPSKAGTGVASHTLTHRYSKAGTYEAFFTFFGRSYRPGNKATHPWDEPPGDSSGRCIDPYASSARVEVTITVR